MKKLLVPIILSLVFVSGCQRENIEIENLTLSPSVTVTYNKEGNFSTINSGLVFSLYSENLNSDKEYLVVLKSPSSLYKWEFNLRPTAISNLKVLFKSDLLFPTEIEEGLYLVELFSQDGGKIEYSYNLNIPNRYNTLSDEAVMATAENFNESWLLQLLDKDGNLVTDESEAYWKVAKRFDDQSAIMLIVRFQL
jgi:hypothetical protein